LLSWPITGFTRRGETYRSGLRLTGWINKMTVQLYGLYRHFQLEKL
jgi:hypothetical protein